MRKTLALVTLAFTLALFAGIASAAEQGGFKGPGIGISTVEEAKQMRDDASVALRGTIVRSLGKDKYEFKDATGTITIEIDDEDWRGVTVQPTDTVEIYGEVDRSVRRVKIDVDRVVKVQ